MLIFQKNTSQQEVSTWLPTPHPYPSKLSCHWRKKKKKFTLNCTKLTS